jgi:hypothetical protein
LPDDLPNYLHEHHLESLGKYAYFLLAGTASAIALALNRTAGHPLALSDVGLALALLCWGISFYYGCRSIQETQAMLSYNIDLYAMRNRLPPRDAGPVERIPADDPPPENSWEAFAEAVADAKQLGADAGKSARLQFRFLLWGAGLYVLWHVAGMGLCTPSLQDRLAPLGSCVSDTASPTLPGRHART